MNIKAYSAALFPEDKGSINPDHLEQSFEGLLDQVIQQLPTFGRSGLAVAGGMENPFLDVITRHSFPEGGAPYMPVGVVSKRYRLLPHAEIAGILRSACIANGVEPSEVRAEVQLSAFGARMAMFLRLPRRFDFDPGDGYPLALRVACFNSVDGSSKLRVMLGWYRLVCANGMAVGTTRYECQQLHREDAEFTDIAPLLSAGIEAAEREKAGLKVWLNTTVNVPGMVAFADGALAKAWGIRAAARFLHIATTGMDAELAQPFQPGPPHSKAMRPTRAVPGSPMTAKTAYEACQALTWLARDRRDPLEAADWMLQVPALMKILLQRIVASRTP